MRYHGWLPTALLALGLGAAACEPMDPGKPGNLVPLTVAEDATLPAIDMNGSRFHVQAFGDPAKPVIVFLHGGPGGDYRSLLRLAGRYDGYGLTDDYYLVYWDQRGSGLSRRHDKDVLNIATFVADLDSLVNRYSPGRPVYLVGESWGGMFATRYIDEHPGRVAGAVLIEPGPLDGRTMERLKDDIRPIDLGSELANDIAWDSQFFSPDDHARMDFEATLGVKDGQPKYHLSHSDPSPIWRLGAAANRYLMESGQDHGGKFDYDFTTHLSAFHAPVLFIAGSLSEVLGPSLQQQQVHRYPSASLTVVPGAGHDVAWVKTADVLALIRAYLTARQRAAIQGGL